MFKTVSGEWDEGEMQSPSRPMLHQVLSNKSRQKLVRSLLKALRYIRVAQTANERARMRYARLCAECRGVETSHSRVNFGATRYPSAFTCHHKYLFCRRKVGRLGVFGLTAE